MPSAYVDEFLFGEPFNAWEKSDKIDGTEFALCAARQPPPPVGQKKNYTKILVAQLCSIQKYALDKIALS